jgi:hypothetical protein
MGETSIRHDQDSFTLISSDRQERVIHPSNTQIVRFESDPHMDCIERAFVDPHEYEAHEQLFIRDERILTIVEALGFKTVRFAETPDNYVDAYTSPRNHSSELEWDIQDFTARSLISSGFGEFNVVEKDYTEMFQGFPSPVVNFVTKDKLWLEMTYINSAIYRFDTHPEMDHVYVRREKDGEVSEHYVFDEDMLIEDLEDKKFPSMRSPYPGITDLEEYVKWQHSRIADDWRDLLEADQNGPEQGIGGDPLV